MSMKTTFLLTALAVLNCKEIGGNPMTEIQNSDEISTVLPGSRIQPRSEWINFHPTWSFPSFPSVSSLFHDDDKEENEVALVKKRIESLERTQKNIIEMLQKISQEISAISQPKEQNKPEVVLPGKKDEKPILSAKPVNNKNEIIVGDTENVPNPVESTIIQENEEQVPIKDETPEVENKPIEILNPSLPSTSQNNMKPSESTDDKHNDENSNGNSTDIQNVSEKIQSVSQVSEAKPEVYMSENENPIGSISLVGFAPSSDSRINGRMPSNRVK